MKKPNWIRSDRLLDRLVILAIAGVALWVSATVLASLAGRLDWLGLTRWGLPVCIDALAIYSVAKWIDPRTPEHQREVAKTTAWSMLGVSILGNAIEHLFRAGPTLGAVLSIAAGAIPPVTAFVAIHIYALGSVGPSKKRRTGPTTGTPGREAREPVQVEPVAPEPIEPEPTKPEPLHSVPEPRAESDPETERRVPADLDEVKAWIRDQKELPSKRAVAKVWVIGGDTALKLIRQVKTEREAA